MADYIRALEAKNKRLIELVRQYVPTSDEVADHSGLRRPSPLVSSSSGEMEIQEDASADGYLETMIDGTGQLRQDRRGSYSYHGHYAGLTLLERVHTYCRQLVPALTEDTTSDPTQIFDQSAPWCRQYLPTPPKLPEKVLARNLVTVALNDACCLMTFVNKVTFGQMFERIYSIDKDHYQEADLRFLALFYAALAVGSLFIFGQQDRSEADTSAHHAYFQMAHAMIDPTQCRDLTTIQAIILLIMYLQASGRLSHCYSYLALAAGSATQIGIHRKYTPISFDAAQAETRKRVYWTLCTMDVYLSNVLGLSRTIPESVCDQDLPGQSTTEYATQAQNNSIKPPSPRLSSLVNHHIGLVRIMSKVVGFLCPTSVEASEPNRYRRVEATKLSQIEAELAEWYRALPPMSEDIGSNGYDQICIHLRLRLAYAHVQMVLYRPFLHHIMGNKARSDAEMRPYACASSCIKAAMQVIWIVRQLHQQGYAVAPYWLTLFMTLFSAMTLVMFALSNEGGATVDEAWEAVNSAVWLFTELSNTSFIAEKCAAILKEFTAKQTSSPTRAASEGGTSICDTGCKAASIYSRGSQSSDTWPIMSSWAKLSDIAATCFSHSTHLLDTAEDLCAGTPTFPTDDTISDDSFWLDESLNINQTRPGHAE
ncbi:Gypsy retrotransposon integrase-like protein 1 [Exophiala xenobiotica]|nr:Gypsy retrotransposon integrase-like protein 1 [Exophiala xenobiotica]